MPTSSLSGRRPASARRQSFAVLTAALLLFQQAIVFAPAASAQMKRATTLDQTTVTKAPAPSGVRKAPASTLDDVPLPNDTGTGSISLTGINTAAPTETFNTLSNTAGSTTNTALPAGWYITEGGGGTRDNEQYAVDTGGSTTGDIYSYGSAASTDRALGELRSGTLIPLFGAKYTNNTGSTISSLDISYTGEQWRFGGVHSTVADRLDFQYSVNATDLSTGTYLDANALDFNPPVTTGTAGALDGNAAANRTAISSTITGLSIPAGASFFIRLNDVDATGADDGLAIDDFNITPHAPTPTPTLSINDVTQDEGNAGTTAFTFTVSLSAAAGVGGVSFTVNTADGTATAPSDYTAIVNGSGSIAQGNMSTNVTVQVNGDATNEPNETFFVNITNVSGATVSDGQGQGTIQNDDVTLTPIHDIQGNGTASPVAGQTVTTTGIVTGIKAGSSGGFFIQEPDATVDADPNTSEGIFVFTGASVPVGAVVGNNVRVSGTVQEFVFTSDPHSPPITELSSVTSTVVISTGNPLPTPHTLTAAETTAPSGTSNPLDSLEEFEGMRVTVPSLTVVAPTAGTITEPSATVNSTGVFYGVVTGVSRPFREAGVNISDPLPAGAPANVPRFDENPERIRVDSDGQPGTTAVNVSAGTTVSNVTGPLDYSFRAYTILPDTTLTGTNGGATPAPTPNSDEFTVASFNMERFFDTTNDPNNPNDPVLTATAFNNRLNKASLIIRNVQRYPDVIGVEEVENLSTLQAVAAKVNSDAQTIDALPDPQYTAYLSEGNDIGGIDVGFLVKQSRVSVVDVTQIEQPGCDHVTPSTCYNYTNPNDGTLDILNDRPPLVLRATINRPAGGTVAFTAIVNHLRSLSSIDDETPQGSGTVGARVREKRRKQAEFLANYIQSRQTADPAEKIITVGDMNALRVNDGYVDVIGTVLGTPAPADQVVLASSDLVNPNQTDLVDLLPADQRYSFTFDGNAQVLDHVIVNPSARSILTRFAYARDDADQPLVDYADPNIPDRISDHDQPVGYFSLGVPQAAGSLLISEFRFRGPGPDSGGGGSPVLPNSEGGRPSAPGTPQDNDEFIELYNNTNSDITVSTLDGSAGWAVVASDGVTRFIVPNDTVIPARGYFLAVNTDGYSLGFYGVGDQVLLPSDTSTLADGYTLDIPDGSGLALFSTADPANYTLANRLDAAGYATVDPLYREGVGFPATGAEATSDLEYSFVRRVCVVAGTGCGAGLPKDTSDNAADFAVVNTDGAATTLGAKLGAPGPQGLTSPVNANASMPGSLLDPSVSASQPPNRVRDFTSDPSQHSPMGTLSIRRKITNNTGAPVTFLAFRIIEVTTYPVPSGTADVRAIDSEDIQVDVNGEPVDVRGTYVEQPPFQPNGGGLNSSMGVSYINFGGNPLAAGDSINVQFLLGIVQTGGYRFYVNVEMLNGEEGPPPAPGSPGLLSPSSPASHKQKKLEQGQRVRQRAHRVNK